MNYSGLIIGVISFIVIGVFHPIVIKCEYYFTDRIWPLFLACGLIFSALSLLVDQIILSATFAVIGFTLFWSIGELKEQKKRVEKGWFPKNPRR
ncbi:MAG TPA: DUF4491 family protein [Anaerovoracaceae bacterium]|nr:DUF4491 family protein [Anaerovoracaceae bacterium]